MSNAINQYAGGLDDLENNYRTLSDDELLQLSIDGGLVPEAEMVLKAEMHRRSLGAKDVKALKDWEEKQSPKPGPTRQRVFLGYGVKFVGHKFLSEEDERKGIFVATKFIVGSYSPLVPLGSYRVVDIGVGLPKIVSKVSLQRDQVWQGLKPFVWGSLIGLTLAALMIYFKERR